LLLLCLLCGILLHQRTCRYPLSLHLSSYSRILKLLSLPLLLSSWSLATLVILNNY
jgi:hypothetical protein